VISDRPIRIFIVYARADRKLREELGKILAAWQRDGTALGDVDEGLSSVLCWVSSLWGYNPQRGDAV